MSNNNSNNKLKQFAMQAELGVYSRVNALSIGRHLKIGLWKDESDQYFDGEKVFTNLKISNVEIRFVEIDQEAELPYFIVSVDCIFQARLNVETAQEQGCIFFGEESASLPDKTKVDTYLIETADYHSFYLSEVTD